MSRKRRWLEIGKTVLILLLSVSAVYLLSMTPLVQDSGVLEWLKPGQTSTEGTTAITLTAAAKPSRMAVSNGRFRYGVQYNQSEVDTLFTGLSPLLGEALVSAGEPDQISENKWQQHLQGAGIYFDFTGEIPLSALSSWLKTDGECALSMTARRVLLVGGQGDEVFLCYQNSEDERFYACKTELSWELHLMPAVKNIEEDNAEFAFEAGEWADDLHPYTLITDENVRHIYSVSTPVTPGGNLTQLLEALDYAGRNHATVSGSDLYLDGNDRLMVLSGGRVAYEAAQLGKYPVPTSGGAMTVAEAIEAARELAEITIGARCGEAELYLESVKKVGEGYQIRFGYRLDGSTVWLYDEGWAAEFFVREGYITEFTLYFRNYVSTGTEALLLPVDRTAAILSDLTEGRNELILQYLDGGESSVVPVWVVK